MSMQENIPLTIERLSDKHEKECRITSALQIQSLLRDIAEEASNAALYYDGAKNFIITTLLGVGGKGFWVEQGAGEAENHRIAQSQKITLVCSHHHVKVQFATSSAREVTHQGYPAFYLPFPERLYRVQRRAFFRLAIPPSEHLHCVIPINGLLGEDQIEVPVMEISGGGVKLSYAGEDVEFAAGQTYENCHIDLPEMGRINFSITLKYQLLISPKQGQTVKRIGCEFNNLNNASNILLQRYVTKVQRLKNEMETGLLHDF